MPLKPLPIDTVLAQLGEYDQIIDARSESEFAADHLPGAVNWPVLDDEERATVGTLYVQVSPLEARKVGAALVARRIAQHLEREMADKPRTWRPVVYCWRGGDRSGTLAWFLSQIGFRTVQLQGGYKAFRARVRADLDTLPQGLAFTVVCGRTGSGKTRLLHALAGQGAQVFDLEGLARHRGSVLGGLPGVPQPTQKAFETALWDALRRFDPARPVFIESESGRIGLLRVPEVLIDHARSQGRCVVVTLPDAERVRLLLQEYGFFADDPARFCALIEPLVELRGRATVARWQAQAQAGQWAECFAELMALHYDPLYDRSMKRDFAKLADAPAIAVADASPEAFSDAARRLLMPG